MTTASSELAELAALVSCEAAFTPPVCVLRSPPAENASICLPARPERFGSSVEYGPVDLAGDAWAGELVQGLPDQVRAADLSASFEPSSMCSPWHRGWLGTNGHRRVADGEEAATEGIPIQAKASSRTDAHTFL